MAKTRFIDAKKLDTNFWVEVGLKAGVNHRDCKKVYYAFLDELVEELRKNIIVKADKFGFFYILDRKPTNVKLYKKVEVGNTKCIKFHPTAGLKAYIKDRF